MQGLGTLSYHYKNKTLGRCPKPCQGSPSLGTRYEKATLFQGDKAVFHIQFRYTAIRIALLRCCQARPWDSVLSLSCNRWLQAAKTLAGESFPCTPIGKSYAFSGGQGSILCSILVCSNLNCPVKALIGKSMVFYPVPILRPAIAGRKCPGSGVTVKASLLQVGSFFQRADSPHGAARSPVCLGMTGFSLGVSR